MALSGRAFAVALLAVFAVLAIRSAVTIAVVDGLLLIAIVIDVLLAAPVSKLSLERAGDTRVRLGEPATVTTTIVNGSRRPLRAQLRDAWPPSADSPPGNAADRPAGRCAHCPPFRAGSTCRASSRCCASLTDGSGRSCRVRAASSTRCAST